MKQSSVCFSLALILLVVFLYGSHSSGRLWSDIPILFRYHHYHSPNPFHGGPMEVDSLTGYLEIDSNDSDFSHRMLYNQLLFVVDSIHQVSADPRVDSIWRFIRPKLEYANGLLDTNTKRASDKIYIFPLMTGEDRWAPCERNSTEQVVTSAVFCYKEGIQSITVFDMDDKSFLSLAIDIYHESSHALNYSKKAKKSKDSEHAEILTLECSILSTLMDGDSTLKKSYDSFNFTNSVLYRVDRDSPYFDLKKSDQGMLESRFHAISLMKKEGTPKTDQGRLNLYHRVHRMHLVLTV